MFQVLTRLLPFSGMLFIVTVTIRILPEICEVAVEVGEVKVIDVL